MIMLLFQISLLKKKEEGQIEADGGSLAQLGGTISTDAGAIAYSIASHSIA
jgi:hypothetical protein